MADTDDFTPRKTIQLARPVTPYANKPPINAITLKEPSGGLYKKLGEPRILVQARNGGGYFVEQNEAISGYLDKCVDHELGGDLIDLLCLADAMRVKMELFGFLPTPKAKLCRCHRRRRLRPEMHELARGPRRQPDRTRGPRRTGEPLGKT